jgi:anti-sigma B factor antagonist
MLLSLQTRDVGRVTVIRCNGRIVSGPESESLITHVASLLHDRRAIVLHMEDVVYVDSSGLGTMVRALTSVRQKGGDLKLCNVPERTRQILQLTNLVALFDSHDSEEAAIAAFYRKRVAEDLKAHTGVGVLCVHQNLDVLAYLRELMRRAGYEVHSSASLPDALILMRVMKFGAILLGPTLPASPAVKQNFDRACGKSAKIELGKDFSLLEAGDAASELLKKVGDALQASAAGNA